MSKIIIRNRLDPDNVVPVPTSLVWTEINDATATSSQFPTIPPTSYLRPVFDPLSQCSIWPLPRSTSIYSTDYFAYRSSTKLWTRIGGTGTALGEPSNDGSASTDLAGNPKLPWPGDRHPIEQLAMDTVRNQLHQYGGIAQPTTYEDHWVMSMQATVQNSTFELLLSGSSNVPSVLTHGSMVYASAEDMLVTHGGNTGSFPRTWVFALGSGAASAAQIAAGAATRGEWYETYAPGVVTPPLDDGFAHVAYAAGKVYQFVRKTFAIWAYDIAAQTWTNMSVSGITESGLYDGVESLLSTITDGALEGQIYYRLTSHDSVTSTPYGDWLYNPGTNTLSQLTTVGVGPRSYVTHVVFDPTLGSLGGFVSLSNDGGLWHAELA